MHINLNACPYIDNAFYLYTNAYIYFKIFYVILINILQ